MQGYPFRSAPCATVPIGRGGVAAETAEMTIGMAQCSPYRPALRGIGDISERLQSQTGDWRSYYKL
jgi:hypothetical protein